MAKNKDKEMLVEESEDMGGEPRVYELGFHLDPELPVEEAKKVYQEIHDRISQTSSVVAEVEARKIPLAYTISRQEVGGRRDFSSAYFAWIVYETTPENHAEIIAAVNDLKSVIRFIDLITTKDQARHALEMHELSEKTVESEEETEKEMDTKIDEALESVAV